MGRQSAGASFLAGYTHHARSRDLVCMAPDRSSAEEFAETTRQAVRTGTRPLRNARWVSFDMSERLGDATVGPVACEDGVVRRRTGGTALGGEELDHREPFVGMRRCCEARHQRQ